MTKKVRGVTFEENNNNSMGLEFYNLSHRFAKHQRTIVARLQATKDALERQLLAYAA